MTPSNRIIINTLAQYVKTILSCLLSVFTTRFVLNILGVEDFSIYTLVGGVVALLSFVTNALSATTQRFISYYQGKSDVEKLKEIFSNSVLVHFLLGIICLVLCMVFSLFLFDGFLKIEPNRLRAAQYVFVFVLLMIFLSFLSSPFRALLISHENIVFLSIVDVLDSLLKFIFVIFLNFVSADSLIVYSFFIFCVYTFDFIIILVYTFYNYEECIFPKIKDLRIKYVRELSSFASWTIYSTACIVGRTQGIAIVLNRFIGSNINAAYGIGLQISGYTSFISSSLISAISPQLTKAEGAGNREMMFKYSELESKFSFILLSLIAIPAVFEMPTILNLWLEIVPDNSVLFSRMILLAALVDMLTVGLGSANSAIGDIKRYSLFINTLKLLTLPVVWLCLYSQLSLFVVSLVFVLFELICALCRIPFLKQNGGLNAKHFIMNVIYKILFPFIVFIIICYLCNILFVSYCRLLIIFLVPSMIYITLLYRFSLSAQEKNLILSKIKFLKDKVFMYE